MSSDTSPLVAKVLTVSDGVVAGTRVDSSGQKLADILVHHGFTVLERRVCSDGADVVADELRDMCENFAGLIVTTGGTGFAPRDQTPEGTLQVIDRQAPGLSEAMRAINPLGRLSRGIVGTRGRTLICNTPGSPTGSVEQIEAIIDVLAHAIRLLGEESTSH